MKKKIIAFGLLAIFILPGCGTVQEADMASAAFYVNGEAVSLREWNFYLRMNQMEWEREYLEDYGDEMWSVERETDGETMEGLLREETFESIVKNHILCGQAAARGLELSEEEKQNLTDEAERFMEAYHQALLGYAGADKAFVYECLERMRLGNLALEAMAADYQPDWDEEEIARKGICYVLISTSGIRHEDGSFTPYSEEEIARRTKVAYALCGDARASGSLKEEAEKLKLVPIEATVGKDNTADGQEPLMLEAARALEPGEISDPVKTEEGWFLVQLLNDYDEEGTKAWGDYLLEQEKSAYGGELYEKLRGEADIERNEEIMEQIVVKKPLKDLL